MPDSNQQLCEVMKEVLRKYDRFVIPDWGAYYRKKTNPPKDDSNHENSFPRLLLFGTISGTVVVSLATFIVLTC